MEKIDPTRKVQDLSFRSLEILESKCAEYLKRHCEPGSIWFPDTNNFIESKADARFVHIVLMGGYFKRFLESGLWPFESYKIWVLSSASKRVLVELCHIPDESVAVIPRYALFPQGAARPILPGKEMNLIYAGRLTASKNIDSLLLVTHHLQTRLKIAVKLKLFGDFDNSTSSDLGRIEHNNYEELIKKLVKAYKWSYEPEFIKAIGPFDWVEKIPENSVLVNFSTFMSEDFSVSCAQAQEAGIPCLVPDYGGFSDMVGNVFFFSNLQIPRVFEATEIRDAKVEILAQRISELLRTSPRTAKKTEVTTEEPKPISIQEVGGWRWQFANKLGVSGALALKDDLATFADTPEGMQVFRKYRRFMAGENIKTEKVIFTNDLNELTRMSSEIRNNFELACAGQNAKTTIIIQTKEFSNSEYQQALENASEIYFCYFEFIHVKILRTLLQISKNSKNVFIPKATSAESIRDAETLLSNSSHVLRRY